MQLLLLPLDEEYLLMAARPDLEHGVALLGTPAPLLPPLLGGGAAPLNTEIRLIIFFTAKDGEALYSQQTQDRKLTVAQIMNSLLPNSDLR